jgi:hypothetical protein
MKLFIVLGFDVEDPAESAGILHMIDPPSIPFFDGIASIVLEPFATELKIWLDE